MSAYLSLVHDRAKVAWQEKCQIGWSHQAYWLLCKPALEKFREERGDPTLYEEGEEDWIPARL
ncbi:MAG: hypothetical protein M3Q62_06010 [Actinomycetota bacterium]|jgi:hypothetical protein|nr:hypothetical protein [Actinomycetota bacterium]